MTRVLRRSLGVALTLWMAASFPPGSKTTVAVDASGSTSRVVLAAAPFWFSPLIDLGKFFFTSVFKIAKKDDQPAVAKTGEDMKKEAQALKPLPQFLENEPEFRNLAIDSARLASLMAQYDAVAEREWPSMKEEVKQLTSAFKASFGDRDASPFLRSGYDGGLLNAQTQCQRALDNIGSETAKDLPSAADKKAAVLGLRTQFERLVDCALMPDSVVVKQVQAFVDAYGVVTSPTDQGKKAAIGPMRETPTPSALVRYTSRATEQGFVRYVSNVQAAEDARRNSSVEDRLAQQRIKAGIPPEWMVDLAKAQNEAPSPNAPIQSGGAGVVGGLALAFGFLRFFPAQLVKAGVIDREQIRKLTDPPTGLKPGVSS